MNNFISPLVLYFLLLPSLLNAQFNLNWHVSYYHTTSLNFSNESRKLATDATGNIFVLADATSDIDISGNPTSNEYHYVIVVKYSPAGNLIVQKAIDVVAHTVNGFEYRSSFDLDVDPSGKVYIAYHSFDPVSLKYGFHVNIFDNNLNDINEFKFNDANMHMYGVDMCVNSTGSIALIGKNVSGANTQYVLYSSNSNNTALDPVFNFDQNVDVVNKVCRDPAGHIYVTGYSMIAGAKSLLAASFNSNGSLRWKNMFNGGSVNRDDYGTNLYYGPDDIYICGASDRGIPDGFDSYVLKLSSITGKRIWEKYLHHGANDAALFISADLSYAYIGALSGNHAICYRLKTSTGSEVGKGNYQPVPVSPHTTVNSVTLSDFKVSVNTRLYMTGTVYATDLSGNIFTALYLVRYYINLFSREYLKKDYELPVEGSTFISFKSTELGFNHSTQNVILLRDYINDNLTHDKESVELLSYGLPSAIREGEVNPSYNLSVNTLRPGVFEFIVPWETNDAFSVTVYDISGKVCRQLSHDSSPFILNLSDLKNGVYLIRIQSEDQIYRTKIMLNQ